MYEHVSCSFLLVEWALGLQRTGEVPLTANHLLLRTTSSMFVISHKKNMHASEARGLFIVSSRIQHQTLSKTVVVCALPLLAEAVIASLCGEGF